MEGEQGNIKKKSKAKKCGACLLSGGSTRMELVSKMIEKSGWARWWMGYNVR